MLRRFNVFTGELDVEGDPRPGYAQRATAVDEAIGGDTIGGALWELEEGERVCP